MGAPPKLKRKYEVPRKAWEKERIEKERELLKKYGIRRKRELWRMEDMLRNLKRRARTLVGKPNPEEEKKLIKKAYELGLVEKDVPLDNILALEIENILERRLQTQVVKAGLANSLKQARQFIVHNHIAIAGQKVKSPAYLVKRKDESKISFGNGSSLVKRFQIMAKKEIAAVKAERKAEEKIEAPVKGPEKK